MNPCKARTSMVIVEAKARAKPANDALIWGLKTAINPAIAMMQQEIRLKRTDSQRLTSEYSMSCSRRLA